MTTDATDFTVQVTTTRGEPVLVVTGELDLATVGNLRRRLHSVIEHSEGDLVLDLSNVGYLDSSGLSVVLEARDLLHRDERTLVIADPSAPVTTILELCGLTDHVVIRLSAADEQSSVPIVES